MALIQTSFGFHSTAEDVTRGVDLIGKRVIVTGAASGIGIETARAFAAVGADVTLAVRDIARGDLAAADIRERTGNRRVNIGRLDCSTAIPSRHSLHLGQGRCIY